MEFAIIPHIGNIVVFLVVWKNQNTCFLDIGFLAERYDRAMDGDRTAIGFSKREREFLTSTVK